MRPSSLGASLLVGVLVPAAPAISADETVVRCQLSQCIAAAFETRPALQAGAARLAAAGALVEQLRAERGIALDVIGGTGYITGESISPFGAFGGRNPDQPRRLNGPIYDVMMRLRMPLISEGRPLGQGSRSEREASLTASGQELAQNSLRRQAAAEVARAYYDAVQCRRAAPLYEGIAAAQREIVRDATARFEQRLIARDQLTLAEVELEMAERDVEVNRIALATAQRRLARSIGHRAGQAEPLDETVEPPPAGREQVPADAESCPDVRAGLARLAAKDEEISRIKAERLPSVDLAARFGIADTFDRPVNDQFYVGLRVTIPLFDSGLVAKRQARAQAERTAERADLEQLRLDLTSEIEEQASRIDVLNADAPVLRAQVQQAQEALKSSSSRQSQGLASPADTARATLALLRLQLEQLRADQERAYLRTRLRIVAGDWDSEIAARPES